MPTMLRDYHGIDLMRERGYPAMKAAGVNARDPEANKITYQILRRHAVSDWEQLFTILREQTRPEFFIR